MLAQQLVAAVHPRWRGEQLPGKKLVLYGIGSSPLARGTDKTRAPRCFIVRFIPAGAGNRLASAIEVHQASVHPRWRGEQTKTV